MFPWPIIITYCIFAVFATQQKVAYRDFEGASEVYHFCLGGMTLLTMLFTAVFLIFYGYRTTWWLPFILYAIGVLVYLPFSRFSMVKSRFAVMIWAMGSFLVVPICAVLLIKFTP